MQNTFRVLDLAFDVRRQQFTMFRRLFLVSSKCRSVRLTTSARRNTEPVDPANQVIPSNTPATSSGNRDLLADSLRKAAPDKLFELVETHHAVMNDKHLVYALESLFRYKRDESLTDSPTSSPHFATLCNSLRRRATFFYIEEVLTVLKCLSVLGVASDTPVAQTYYQMLRHQINDLSFKQALYVDFLLKKQTSTPLVEALKIAVPLVVENQIDIQLDASATTDIALLVRLYAYGVEKRLGDKFHRKVTDAVVERGSELNGRQACDLLWAWAKAKKGDEKLFDVALDVLVAKIEEFRLRDVIALTQYLNLKRIVSFKLLKAVAKRAVDEGWPFAEMYALVRVASDARYADTAFLDRFARLVVDHEDVVANDPSVSIHTVLDVYAGTSYAPRNLRDLIVATVAKSNEKILALSRTPTPFLRFALNLLVFDAFPDAVADVVADPSFPKKLQQIMETLGPGYKDQLCKEALLLSQAANVYPDKVRFEWPDKLKRESMRCTEAECYDTSVRSTLENALGGRQYVASKLFTSSGLFVEHYVALRRGDYPVALQEPSGEASEFKYVESIEVPADSKKIAVVVLRSSQLSWGFTRLTGLARLHVQFLQRSGFHVVQIILPIWNRMPDNEKTSYIMREINSPASLAMESK